MHMGWDLGSCSKTEPLTSAEETCTGIHYKLLQLISSEHLSKDLLRSRCKFAQRVGEGLPSCTALGRVFEMFAAVDAWAPDDCNTYTFGTPTGEQHLEIRAVLEACE